MTAVCCNLHSSRKATLVPLLQLCILAVVQGITEFLPISSSAHLILVPKLTGWPDQGLVIDVAVHVGTLLAVVLYFMKDIFSMIGVFFRSFRQNSRPHPFEPEYLLVLNLIIATIPIIIAGYLANKYLGDALRSLEVIGWTTLGFAFLLFLADKLNMTIRGINHITFRGAFIIGLFQILALIPGTSRAGITMTAARFQGVQRQDAARFSLLLSIPVISAAGVLKGFDLYLSGNIVLLQDVFIVSGISFGFAIITIAFLMIWLKRANFTPFVIYRIVLGICLLFITYWAPEFQL